MSDALTIAASGLKAAGTKLAATASNIANVSTTGSVPDAAHPVSTVYKPLTVSLTPQTGGGVSAQVNADPNGYSLSYDPTSPDANAQGLIAAPNVDLTREIVNGAFGNPADVIDATGILNSNDDFFDVQHPSTRGAEKLSALLGQRIGLLK